MVIKASSNRRGRNPRSGSRRPDPLLRRTSSLSTAGWPRFRSRPAPMASLSRPHKQFINGRPSSSASGYFIKNSAAPMATLSTNGHFIKPMAALSRKPGTPCRILGFRVIFLGMKSGVCPGRACLQARSLRQPLQPPVSGSLALPLLRCGRPYTAAGRPSV